MTPIPSPTPSAIVTERLALTPMTTTFLEPALAGEQERAAAELDAVIPVEWLSETRLMKLRLGQLQEDPGLQGGWFSAHGCTLSFTAR